ncbi:MAG: cupredoxin domain-containing protein [Candidatus Bathyarchaeia archaeon]
MESSRSKATTIWSLSIAALLIAALAVALVAVVYTGSARPAVEEIELLNQQLDETKSELSALRSELAQQTETMTAMMSQAPMNGMMTQDEEHGHETESASTESKSDLERMANMAAIHVAYIDTRSKLDNLQDALRKGDLEAADEAFSQLEITLAHVQWPEILQPHIVSFEKSLDEVHHGLEDAELDEAKSGLDEALAGFHDLDGSFYNTYLPTTMQLVPSVEVELTTKLPAYVEHDGETNPTIEVRAGDVIKLTIVNDDAVEHDIVIDALGVHSSHISGEGESTTVIFMAENPGVYEYYCSVPGHREAGMHGEIIVTAE